MDELIQEISNIRDELNTTKTKIEKIDERKSEPDKRIEAIDSQIEILDDQVENFENQINDYRQRAVKEFNIGNQLDKESAEYRVTERNRIDLRDKALELFQKQEKVKKEKEDLQKKKNNLKEENEQRIDEEKSDVLNSLRERIEDIKKRLLEKTGQVNEELNKNETAYNNVSIILDRFKDKQKSETDISKREHIEEQIEEYSELKNEHDKRSRELLNQKRKLQSLNQDVEKLDREFKKIIDEIQGKKIVDENEPVIENAQQDVSIEENEEPKNEEPKPSAPSKKYFFNGREIKGIFNPETKKFEYFDAKTGKTLLRKFDVEKGSFYFKDIDGQKVDTVEPEQQVDEEFRSLLDDGVLDEELARTKGNSITSSAQEEPEKRVKPEFTVELEEQQEEEASEQENDDFAPIEEIFNGREDIVGTGDGEIDIPMEDAEQNPREVKTREANVNQTSKRRIIKPQLEDIEVLGIENNEFGISKIEIDEATGKVVVYDLDNKSVHNEQYDSNLVVNRLTKNPVDVPDLDKDGLVAKNMYDALINEIIDYDYLSENQKEILGKIDPRVIKSLYEYSVKINSKEPLNILKDYLFSMTEKDRTIPFEMEYNLKKIYNTDLTLEEIKKIKEVSKAAQEMNKEMVTIKKDIIIKRAFGRVKKQIQERIERKALNSGEKPKSKAKEKAKRVIKGIYKNAMIHGMYLKGKLTKEDHLKTKSKVRQFESQFMKDLDVRDILEENALKQKEEQKNEPKEQKNNMSIDPSEPEEQDNKENDDFWFIF